MVVVESAGLLVVGEVVVSDPMPWALRVPTPQLLEFTVPLVATGEPMNYHCSRCHLAGWARPAWTVAVLGGPRAGVWTFH